MLILTMKSLLNLIKTSWNRNEVVELLHQYRESAWINGSTIGDLQQWISKKPLKHKNHLLEDKQ